MKKLIYCAAALATALFAGSCQQELLDTAQKGSTVTYTVEMPQVATKAVGEAESVNNLVYAVYRVTNTLLTDEQAKATLATEPGNFQLIYQEDTPVVKDNQSGKKLAHISLELINDQRYVVIFWAQKDYTWFNKGDSFTTVTYPARLDGNNDAYDAFTNVDVISVDGSFSKDITLVRPFAQLNIATVVPGPTEKYPNRYTDFQIAKTSVVVNGIAQSFNVGAQVGETIGEVSFTEAAPVNQQFNDTYPAYVSMNYVFVLANQSNVKVSYDIVTNKYGTVKNIVPNVPVARNYRTNIIGNLLTSDVQYNVELEDWYVNSNSGTTEVIVDGLVKNQKGDYEISNENGLAWAMNNLFKENANYYLTKEVYDLSGFAVTPPVVPTGVTINIYGETPVVTRAAITFAGITIIGLPVVDGTPTLIAEVANGGSVSVSGVTLDDEGSVLVENNQGTLVVTETEVKSDSYVGEGSKDPVQADNVSTLADLQTSLASGVKQINLASPITIPAGDEVVINLNGKTVIGVDDYVTGSYGLITNNGTLIVEGPGTIQLTATNDRDWNAYSSVISNQPGGNLTVKDGAIIEHLGGSDMAYGIDNLTNGKGTSAITTIEDATVKSPYRAVRQFLNGIEATNELYVREGAVIEGANKSIWMQDPSKNANTGKLVVETGAKLYGDVYLYVCEGSTEWPVEVSIAKSALVDAEILTGNVPATHSVVEENGVWTVKTNEAKVGDVTYLSFAKAVAEAKVGDTITMLSDVTLNSELTLPPGVTLNGNGKQIDGTIYAGGNLTFAGHTKVTSFSASYYNRVITIGEGACLEVTGGGRVSLAYGNTFNITGSLVDAKAADKSKVQPSLIIPAGISITGGSDATMNVTNAYVKIGDTSSKNSAANGIFNLNFTNSIAEFTHQFTFAEPTNGNTPTFNLNVTNCVLTTAAKLCIAAPNTNFVVNNSVITSGTYIRNSGVLEIKNESVVTGKTIQFGENGGNNGSITVDNSKLTITAGNAGYAFDGKNVGSITLNNGAEVNIDYVKDMILKVGNNCTFTYTKLDNCSEVVTNAEELTSAFKEGKNVILYEDIYSQASTTAPYGNKYGYKMDGGVLDGNGYELDIECYGDDYGIMTSGGTIKNLKIDNATRAIMVMYVNEDLTLDNVNIGGNGVLYPINTGEAGPAAETAKLTVSNSTLEGWTSYAFFASATFTNVEFKQGTYYDNIYGRVLKPYVNTTLTNCSFVEHMNLDLSDLANGHKVTMTNCTVNGQAVTAEVMTVPSSDAEYDTKLFTVDLPLWATSINDCIIFN